MLPTIGNKQKNMRRPYEYRQLQLAYAEVKSGKMSVHKAARKYGIPDSTLRDRFRGMQPPPDSSSTFNVSMGPDTTLTKEEERQLVSHCKYMADIGYGYSRNEFINLASDFAVSQKRKMVSTGCFSQSWYNSFKRRHPDITLSKPQKLSMVRAKCTSDEVLDKYFSELESVLTANNIKNKPENVWNIDETGLMMEHNPGNVICGKGTAPQVVTSSRGKNVTIIASGSAVGTRIPPFYVFPGKRWVPELLDGACPGASGTVSETGWSNSIIFMEYLEQHFIKYVPNNGSPILLLLDGHRSHINLTLKKWGEAHNIIFFVMPPHTSHVTQPLDVGCFGPLKRMYYSECQAYMRKHPGMQISRSNVAAISSKAYNRGLTPENLISAFRRSGVCPLQRHQISSQKTAPSVIYREEEKKDSAASAAEPAFLSERKITKITDSGKKRKRNAISIHGNIMSPSKQAMLKPVATEEARKPAKSAKQKKRAASPLPGTSGMSTKTVPGLSVDSDTDSSIDNVTDGSDLCCICKKRTPDNFNTAYTVEFIQWAQCDRCDGWVHLKYCTSIKVVRRGSSFFCARCDIES